MQSSRQFIGAVIALALFAVACRSEVTIDLAETDAARSGEQVADATSAPAPLEGGDEKPAPLSPAAAVVAGATPEPVSFTGEPPAPFRAPLDWDDPFELDGSVVQGELANGLTYLIRNNGRPGSQAQFRMVVQAGSLNEEPGTEGVAHFLEHMMFNGTERFPGNDIVQVLEGFGSSFGPDVNAYTSFEETVYELQVPTRSSDTVQLALDVLFQWATAASIATNDVIAERGVVREEHRRVVESLSGRIGEQIRAVLFEGSDYLGRDPIGTADMIDSMTNVELRAFYERWYRPELMTIVAVGDFDVDEMERRITATFVQTRSAGPVETPRFDTEAGSLVEPVFDVITDSEIQQTEVEVRWRLAAQPVRSLLTKRADLVASMTMSMVNTRLFERVQGGESVLLSARAGADDYLTSVQIVSLSGAVAPDMVTTALDEMLVEIERARQHGFEPQELERELTSARARVEQVFAVNGTRQDSDIARDLVGYSLGRLIPGDAAEQQAMANKVLDSITVDDAQRFLFDVLDTNPYLLLTGPALDEDVLATPEELADGYYSVVGTQVAPTARAPSPITELMDRPEPVAVVDEQSIVPLAATMVTYENGARLVFRQTQITDNTVRLRAVSQGGFFAVDGLEVPLLDRSSRLVAGSGFESIDIVSLDRLLAGSLATLSSSVGRTSESLVGEASTGDMETLFQLLHLQMTEPTISELQIRKFDERWRPLAQDPSLDPAIAADLELWRLRYGDSPWFRLIPTIDDLDALDSDLLLRSYRDRFADAGDFVFAVVGDFDRAELIDLGARYLGTLPDSGRREVPIDRDPGVPEENLVATVAAGVSDQGRVRINWESPYPFTIEADVAAQALDLVVNARLRDLIREELGASYAPNASVSVLNEPKPWVDTIIEVESDPDRVDEVSQVIHQELERIRSGELDQQYLDLAVEQLAESYRFFNNNQWLDLLLFHTRYQDRPPDEFRTRTVIAERLTVADMAETASRVFPPTRSVGIQLIPAN